MGVKEYFASMDRYCGFAYYTLNQGPDEQNPRDQFVVLRHFVARATSPCNGAKRRHRAQSGERANGICRKFTGRCDEDLESGQGQSALLLSAMKRDRNRKCFDALVDLVNRRELPFDWFDAAVLSHQLGQHLAKN